MRKKSKFKLIAMNIFIIFIGTLILNNFVFKAKEIQAITDRNIIKILEIESTDDFKLTQNNSKTGIEEFNYDRTKINITHITMPEYISKVDQINGCYDIVYIGNKGNGYTAPFTKGANYLPYGREVSIEGKVGLSNNQAINGKTYVEYYSENDITNKRAKEIIEMAESGQLVYIDKAALVLGTKIKSNFENINKENIIKVDSDITIEKIVYAYKNATNIKYRPIITIKNKPNGNNRNMNYTFDLITQDNDSVIAKLYLDVNGDSLYKDNELVKKVELKPENNKIENGSINYILPNNFVGLLDWKLEFEVNNTVTGNNIKSYETGSVKYGLYDNKKVNVRVLQILPNGNSKLYLSKDPTANGIKGIDDLVKEVNEYSITFTQLTVAELETKVSSGYKLNGNYDMLILGFDDTYGGTDLSDKSINEIKDFIATGQSVMFTHDTMTYRILPLDLVDKENKKEFRNSSRNLTQKFRDIIGQSRYRDIEYNSNENDIYGGITIVHDSLNGLFNDNTITYGLTEEILKQYYDKSSGANSFANTVNSIYKINNGLINEYPFSIGDIKVADTHIQYYQLNLEDPNVVPWYTLNSTNKYDGRNYYYTYSRGNITYSGTGHSNNFTEDEKKLFINTMVKASRGANHAPTMEILNLDENQKFSKNQENIDFTVIPYDMDNDNIDLTITVKDSSGNKLGEDIVYFNKVQGQPIKISLNNSKYNFSQNEGKVKIEIKAEDKDKAKAEEIRNILLVKDPNISLQYISEEGYLTGDKPTIVLNAITNIGGLSDVAITNIKFIADSKENDKYKLDNQEIVYNNVKIDDKNNADIKEQSKDLKVEIKSEGDINITGKLQYEYNGNLIEQPYTIPLKSQVGKVNISIKDENGQLVNGGNVFCYTSDNKEKTVVNFKGQVKELTGFTTGDYKFTLDSFYIKDTLYTIAEASKTVNIAYDSTNSIKNIEFTATKNPQDLPNIDINLNKLNQGLIYPGDEVQLSYNVAPKEFYNETLKTEVGAIDEAIFLIGLNKNNNDNKISIIQNSIENVILKDSNLINSKIGIIGYNGSDTYIGDINNNDNKMIIRNKSEENTLNNPLLSLSNSSQKEELRRVLQEDSGIRSKASDSTNSAMEISNGLELCKDVFDKFGTKDKRKAIILINLGSVTYNEDIVNKIKSEGYKIISLDATRLTDNNLKTLHEKLGGIINTKDENKTDYLKATLNDNQNYNSVDYDMAKVDVRLSYGFSLVNFSNINPTLSFDLNDNFEYIQDSNSSNINVERYEGNKLTFKLNDSIVYKYTNEVVDGKYEYKADNKKISFNVKIKDDKTGKLGFASNDNTEKYNNYMNYIKFNEVTTNIPIETPIFNVIPKVSEISHGLYNGIVNNKVEIKENTIVNGSNTPLTLAGGSTLIMGSTFNTSSNSLNLSLNIDTKFEQLKDTDIIIYKVINDNGIEKLQPINRVENSETNYTGCKISSINGETNKFNISLEKFNDTNKDIKLLIVYKGTIKSQSSDEILINNIDFGFGLKKDFSIKTNKEMNSGTEKSPRLPDLF